MDEDGSRKLGEVEVERIANNYFSTLFASSGCLDIDWALEGIERRVTRAMNESLRVPYGGDELLQALEQIHPLKTLGSDGMC